MRLNAMFGFAIPILGMALIAFASASPSVRTPGTTGLRALSDSELTHFVGADDGGPGVPPPKDCYPSPASCSPIMPCPQTGAYPCTTCASGGASNICNDAQPQGCTSTGIVVCPTAGRGNCFNGACVVTAPQECGVRYTCP